ncbi:MULTISPECIES: hypothetical protein [Croceibacter]|jgi:hypothetical protein|uniref:hypothetical protein n=1 Tax=Croceibacter TaxID=216431 RepID=UPI000C563838|nr:hypothetical protein [Croceibacter sp.]MBG25927.1 hypothetical protein [Croceibacter sp.]|tara:strand:+ start:19 stop:618 length:600 start_codon:yes stop_codon:yes gene_type:complete
MTILLFSAFLLLIILLIKLFACKKRNSGLRILVGFGIVIGLSALGLNLLFDDSFGASTPVNVRTENLTDKKLKIYSIAFWSNNWNGTGNYVTYDTELKPNGKSDFWFENDGTIEFWIVAKNRNGGIEYLKVITEQKSEFDFEITETKNINSDKIQIAEELTLKKDKSERMKKYAIWSNIGLIGLLILSLVKIKSGGNNV